MQKSFSDLEYAAKRKVTKRERLLGELEAITPWADLLSALAPYYPKGQPIDNCRCMSAMGWWRIDRSM